MRLCQLSELADAEFTTRNVNAISFIENSIETFLHHCSEAADRIFYNTPNPTQIPSNNSEGQTTRTLDGLIGDPTPISNHAFTSTSSPFESTHRNNTNQRYDDFRRDGFMFHCSSDRIPTYEIRNLRPPSTFAFQIFIRIINYKDSVWIAEPREVL